MLTKQKKHKLPPLIYPPEIHQLRGKMKRFAKQRYYEAWLEVRGEMESELRREFLATLAAGNDGESGQDDGGRAD